MIPSVFSSVVQAHANSPVRITPYPPPTESNWLAGERSTPDGPAPGASAPAGGDDDDDDDARSSVAAPRKAAGSDSDGDSDNSDD